MNLDNYEQVDIEINTPADIYRAMLDGYVAEFKTELSWDVYRYSGGWFPEMLNLTLQKIEQGCWALWREKPKPKWWELVSFDRPVICRHKASGGTNLFRPGYDWLNYEPLTDAEIDQLKRGL